MAARPSNDSLRQLVAFHTVNIYLGIICSILAVILIVILGTSSRMLLFTLSLADFSNCIAISLMGVDRVSMYQGILDGASTSNKIAFVCSMQVWLFFRTIGDLWPPIVQTMIGVEQLLKLRQAESRKDRSRQFQCLTIVFVLCATAVGYSVAFVRRDTKVKYYCGRKAAFGKPFSVFVYTHNVLGYIIGLICNCTAYYIARRSTRTGPGPLRQLRVCVIVSTLSTVLVSLPNCLSVVSAVHKSISDAISKPAVYATCVNSGVNIFVYFFLNPEFRKRCIFLLTREFSPDEALVDEDEEWRRQSMRITSTISKQRLLENPHYS